MAIVFTALVFLSVGSWRRPQAALTLHRVPPRAPPPGRSFLRPIRPLPSVFASGATSTSLKSSPAAKGSPWQFHDKRRAESLRSEPTGPLHVSLESSDVGAEEPQPCALRPHVRSDPSLDVVEKPSDNRVAGAERACQPLLSKSRDVLLRTPEQSRGNVVVHGPRSPVLNAVQVHLVGAHVRVCLERTLEQG